MKSTNLNGYPERPSLINMDTVNILVVDDSPTALFDFKRQLSMKYDAENIHTAENVAEAKEILGGQKIDIAVIDMQLPEINGADLISDMKSTDDWKDIPIIVVTGTSSGGILEYGFSQHVEAYVYKPLEPGTLVALVEKNLPKNDNNS